MAAAPSPKAHENEKGAWPPVVVAVKVAFSGEIALTVKLAQNEEALHAITKLEAGLTARVDPTKRTSASNATVFPFPANTFFFILFIKHELPDNQFPRWLSERPDGSPAVRELLDFRTVGREALRNTSLDISLILLWSFSQDPHTKSERAACSTDQDTAGYPYVSVGI